MLPHNCVSLHLSFSFHSPLRNNGQRCHCIVTVCTNESTVPDVDSSLVGCCAAQTGKLLLTFQRSIVPSSLGLSNLLA
jgi:hypothetical protein